MATRFVLTGRTEVVTLHDVPLDLRLKVADRLVKSMGLTGVKALDMQLAAQFPRGAKLEVDAAKAERVRRGLVPPGPMPTEFS